MTSNLVVVRRQSSALKLRSSISCMMPVHIWIVPDNLRRGCPTAYTYAFDDESSTFTCQSADSRDGPEPNTAERLCKSTALVEILLINVVSTFRMPCTVC